MTSLQEEINKIIDKILPVSTFLAAQEIATKVKNTFGVKCPKCHSENVYEQSIQTRSADEISSLFYECLSCGHKWRVG